MIKGALRTWRDSLKAAGQAERQGAVYLCPTCDRPSFAVEIVEATPDNWQCAVCLEPKPASGPPELTWADVRGLRAVFLQATDWTQLGDVPVATQLAYQPLRLRARNVTNLPTVAKGMAEMAALQQAAAKL
jgi:hypothetical protein